MNPIEKLQRAIQEKVGGARATLDRPERSSGRWFLDVSFGAVDLVIEWQKGRGFGVSSASAASLGERPDEVYETEKATLNRVLLLLRTKDRTASPRDVVLKELREKHRISQVELARLLDVSQAAVSKLERRGDMHISTLRRLIAALGGELELRARFPNEVVQIQTLGEVEPDNARRRARR